MDNYTVTFVYNGDFDLPDDKDECFAKVPGMVLDKLSDKEFDLVDFNYTENYNEEQAGHYIADPSLHRCVLEIVTALNKKHLQSRDAIYDKCINDLAEGNLYLGCAYENDNPETNMLQSIIKFVNNSQKAVCIPAVPAGENKSKA
ncbi:hypothetical protein [Flavobacterium coralii]|uniref:hypothetical protein n=1 Tax=Flavobacterium coralii TaxID=2838017 RepID=UPI0032B28235|tara:strand:+ start:394 stop:828 length:435 start_codon:yes stop_codon:yes gene_type:complete